MLSPALRIGLLAGGVVGAALLVAAEFAPLLTVRSDAPGAAVTTVTTSAHDAWALIPLALLALFLTLVVWRSSARVALLALAAVGVVAALIALLGDLPDAQATGVLRSHFVPAASTPAAGFYLETLGAALLVIAGGAGLLLISTPGAPLAAHEDAHVGGPVPD